MAGSWAVVNTKTARMKMVLLLVGMLLLGVATFSSAAEPNVGELRAMIKKLEPLHKRLGRPAPGDWLASHEEDGQTFDQYVASRPVTPTGKRRTIYIQPLGQFSARQREIVRLTGDFMGLYFDRPVKIQKDLPLSVIPKEARRVHPQWDMPQILSTYVLDEVLEPRLPADAAAYLALTASDLWPGAGWNFVFGQASLRDRVGVWSLYRNGDAEGGADAFRECLGRTLRTATHETGHMFSLQHCTLYECNMCGSNHREEADRYPLYLCPQCTAKLTWATGSDPVVQSKKLADFCRKHGLGREEKYYTSAAKVLSP